MAMPESSCCQEDGDACGPFIDQEREIADLKRQLWLLLGDVEARAVSCTCYPPLTKHERYHIERAKALLVGYEPEAV